MQKITAFLHLGPLIMPNDVADFDVKKQLSADTYDHFDGPNLLVESAPVGMPVLQSGDWAWMQPYVEPGKGKVPDDELGGRAFIPLKMRPVDEKPGSEDDPYTAVEGYLQLRNTP
ncbi:hypothetical protein B0J13DRAFT_560349 [Dactylonectria estremocensis]|uniref:Uncharacterized protein n=1 Tax=Dactylonectria estremocensis TaxID=1079267 RepID=A0A9P9ECS6_9HYPO|nr:hypothetical protein B0J13DRAFT_560349 [Dactylonectria estremocensis]